MAQNPGALPTANKSLHNVITHWKYLNFVTVLAVAMEVLDSPKKHYSCKYIVK